MTISAPNTTTTTTTTTATTTTTTTTNTNAILPPADPAPAAGALSSNERKSLVAVVGMACRFPGSANSPELFWDLLVDQRDAGSKIPADRFNVDRFFVPRGEHHQAFKPGTVITNKAYFIDSKLDEFDALFFGINGKEASAMDPQQR